MYKRKRYLKVISCRAYNHAFGNIHQGGIYAIIEPPIGENRDLGEWVKGIGEPVCILYRDFNYVNML